MAKRGQAYLKTKCHAGGVKEDCGPKALPEQAGGHQRSYQADGTLESNPVKGWKRYSGAMTEV